MPEETTTRAEHLAWAKERALALCDVGDDGGSFTSMVSDLNKHPHTRNHAALELGALLLFAGHLSGPGKMREFIDGFN